VRTTYGSRWSPSRCCDVRSFFRKCRRPGSRKAFETEVAIVRAILQTRRDASLCSRLRTEGGKLEFIQVLWATQRRVGLRFRIRADTCMVSRFLVPFESPGKGIPVARRGRKATGLSQGEAAGLPKGVYFTELRDFSLADLLPALDLEHLM
jgi:hypothetical protein